VSSCGSRTANETGDVVSALEDGPSPSERHTDRERVLAELRERIRSRLKPVIGHLPDGEVDALVERIASFKYRHEGKAALRSTPARGTPVDPIGLTHRTDSLASHDK